MEARKGSHDIWARCSGSNCMPERLDRCLAVPAMTRSAFGVPVRLQTSKDESVCNKSSQQHDFACGTRHASAQKIWSELGKIKHYYASSSTQEDTRSILSQNIATVCC